MADRAKGALTGLRVIGLSNTLVGVRVSQVLADFGADVVEIERPGGSPLRADAAWPFWSRGKKSIELDLASPTDNEVAARRLVLGADVVVETFRPGVAERLGLGYEDLAADNPGLVYASITGFGRHGPHALAKGYEGLVMAKIGGLTAFGRMVERQGPAFPVVQYATFSAAQTALHAILAALFERGGSGRGQWVESNLVQALAAHDTFNWFVRVISERYPGAFSTAPTVADGVPSGGLSFRLLTALTADGRWIQFSQTSEHLFRAFMRAVDLDWMFDDPEWRTAPDFDDVDRRVRYWEMLLEAVRSRTLAEWQDVFDADPDVWGEQYRHGHELLEHPQILHDNWVTEVDDPRLGTMRQLAPMVRMSATPGVAGRSPLPNGDAGELRLRAASAPVASAPAASATAVSATADLDPGPARPPLEGITVVEISSTYAAPFGATLLAELGARVIKLEPITGDAHRSMLPAFPETAGIKVLQGKESVAVDLTTPEGRQIAYEVVRRSDVVLQSFRAGAAERLGLDPDTLRGVNPDLVYLSAPGYGTDGPCGHRPAYAPTIAAGAGVGWRNAAGVVREGPDLSLGDIKANAMRLSASAAGLAHPDGFSALGVATAMLLGLVARQRGAGGQALNTTMLSTTAHALADDMIEYEGRPPAATADPGLYGLSARYRLYETAAGWVFLAAPQEGEWAALASSLAGRVDLAGDPRFADEAARRCNDDELAEVLGGVLRTQGAAQWEHELTAADVGCAEVGPGPFEAWLLDPDQGGASGFLTWTTHPLIGEHPRLSPLVRLSRSATIAGPACLTGQHTAAVLGEIGYSERAVGELARRGVIGLGSTSPVST